MKVALDTNVLAHAKAGIYDGERVESIPDVFRKRHLTMLDDGQFQIDAALRSLISFAQLNLLESWPMRGPFEAIFCRNVMIYFDEAEQKRLIDKFYRCLNPEGYLFIGHAESLFGLSDKFKMIHLNNGTAYQRIEAAQ